MRPTLVIGLTLAVASLTIGCTRGPAFPNVASPGTDPNAPPVELVDLATLPPAGDASDVNPGDAVLARADALRRRAASP